MSIFNISKNIPSFFLKNDRWRELFEAIEEVLDSELLETVKRVDCISSVFTAKEIDLKRYREEIDPLYWETFDEDNIRVSLFVAISEKYKKNTIDALRPFLLKTGIKSIDWEPLYIAKTADYTKIKTDHTLLRTEAEINKAGLDLKGFWLTSRGQITFGSSPDIDNGYIYQLLKGGVNGVRPVHIVWDGFYSKEGFSAVTNESVELVEYQNIKLEVSSVNI